MRKEPIYQIAVNLNCFIWVIVGLHLLGIITLPRVLAIPIGIFVLLEAILNYNKGRKHAADTMRV